MRGRTRKAILDAAMTVLADNPAAPLADIATAADVGRSTVHRYFPERIDLIRALAVHVHALSSAAIEQADPDLRTAGRGPAPGGRMPTRPRTDRAVRLQRADGTRRPRTDGTPRHRRRGDRRSAQPGVHHRRRRHHRGGPGGCSGRCWMPATRPRNRTAPPATRSSTPSWPVSPRAPSTRIGVSPNFVIRSFRHFVRSHPMSTRLDPAAGIDPFVGRHTPSAPGSRWRCSCFRSC